MVYWERYHFGRQMNFWRKQTNKSTKAILLFCFNLLIDRNGMWIALHCVVQHRNELLSCSHVILTKKTIVFDGNFPLHRYDFPLSRYDYLLTCLLTCLHKNANLILSNRKIIGTAIFFKRNNKNNNNKITIEYASEKKNYSQK